MLSDHPLMLDTPLLAQIHSLPNISAHRWKPGRVIGCTAPPRREKR